MHHRRAASTASIWVVLTAGSLCGQSTQADLDALERTVDTARKELRHDDLLSRYRQLAAELEDAPAQATIAARIGQLTLEFSVLQKAGPIEQVQTTPLSEVVATLAVLDNNAEEELALATFCFLNELSEPGEHALGRARDRDPGLREHTDRLLAAARGEPVPRGGYHRYRGEWMPLARRDHARAADVALEQLFDLQLAEVELPLTPERETTNLDAFARLGGAGPLALRTAAAAVRDALRTDYNTVRSWLSSYEQHPRIRDSLLEAHAAMAPVRRDAIALIRRYEKPQQPQVDAFRSKLTGMYGSYEKLVGRDRMAFDRVTPKAAFALRERVRRREAALVAVDAYLGRYAKPGLPKVALTAAANAATSPQRRLPGRTQSELEDVLWLLVHFRAGLAKDVVDRAAELRRNTKGMTPWEVLLIDELLADAVDLFNARMAVSLDRVEWSFVDTLNRYRRVLGLRPFELEERCNVASRKHSQEMVDLGYFGHMSPVARNRGPSDRVRLEGYNGGVGENCLAGGGAVSGPGAFNGWYHSPGHHRGMISGGIHLGVGAADGHRMWTMVAGGSDLSWRGMHKDLPPEVHAELEAIASELALGLRKEKPGKKERARREAALARARSLLPDILPSLARLAFPASKDPRDPNHAAAPALLGFLVDADVRSGWRTLQVAAIAASIDCMRFGGTVDVRRRVFDVVEPHLTDSAEYAPTLNAGPRREAVLAVRKHWEDVAQWSYRRDAKPPEAPKIPGRVGDGPSLEAPLKVLTKPERLRLARRNGGGTKTEQAIDRALDWLAKVQDEDGAWRGRSFLRMLPNAKPRGSGIGNAEHEIAMTGLALLAFATSGHTTDQGDYQGAVRDGAQFLLQQIVDYGKFDTLGSHYMYSHAIGTQALCELYAYTADPQIGLGAQLTLDFLAYAQHRPSGGWRYNANQQGDTSVVGWVVMALNAGYKAQLDVAGFRDAMRFIESMTQPGYYQVGYTGRPGLARENLRLTSVGMVSRLFLGQAPEAPPIAMPCWRFLEHKPTTRTTDFYYWYYATLAMYQRGGEFWDQWNEALKPTMLALQISNRGSPYYGSWSPAGPHAGAGGRIYQTALGVLILTTYYRYDRSPKIKMHPFTGNIGAVVAPYIDVLRDASNAQQRTIALSKLLDELGPSAVSEIVKTIRDAKQPIALRKLLAQSLITIVRPQHEQLLLPLLDQKDGHIVEHVTRALISISSEQSLDALIAALRHGSHRVRSFAATALGRIGDARATTALADRLKHERNGGTKKALQSALRRIDTRDSITQIVADALGERSIDRLMVLEGLDVLETGGISKRLLARKGAENAIYRRCIAAIKEHREAAAVAVLLELLASEDLDTRRESIKLLRALTGRQFGFDEKKSSKQRKKPLERWREWWDRNQGGYGKTG